MVWSGFVCFQLKQMKICQAALESIEILRYFWLMGYVFSCFGWIFSMLGDGFMKPRFSSWRKARFLKLALRCVKLVCMWQMYGFWGDFVGFKRVSIELERKKPNQSFFFFGWTKSPLRTEIIIINSCKNRTELIKPAEFEENSQNAKYRNLVVHSSIKYNVPEHKYFISSTKTFESLKLICILFIFFSFYLMWMSMFV